MTVASDTTVAGPFTLNGVTTTFPYGFRILDDEEVEFVIRDNSTGIETVADPADYSVTGVGESSGGNFVFGTAPTSGTGFARRVGEMTQPLNITNYGPFFASSVMTALDRLHMYLLEVREEGKRALRGAIGEAWDPVPAAAFRASKVMTFDENGDLDLSISRVDVLTVAGLEAEIEALGDLTTELSALYSIRTNITTVAGLASEVAALGPITAAISGVAAIDTEVAALAAISSDITTVAGMQANIAAILSYEDDLSTIAAAVETAVAGAVQGPATHSASTFARWNSTPNSKTLVERSASEFRGDLGLGTAAQATIGTSGDTVPKNNTANTMTGLLTLGTAGAGTVAAHLLDNNYLRLGSGANRRFLMGGNGTQFVCYIHSSSDTFEATALQWTLSTNVANFINRPTFNSLTALDTGNGAQLAASNTFTGAQQRFQNGSLSLMFDETDAPTNERKSAYVWAAGTILYRLFSTDELSAATVWSLTRSAHTPLVWEFDNCDLRIEPSPTTRATNSAGFAFGGPGQSFTDNDTLEMADFNDLLLLNAATAKALTIPPNSSVAFPINNTGMPVDNIGAGTWTLTPGSGVTLLDETGASGSIDLDQYDGGVLYKRDTNTWVYRGTHA